MEGSCQVAATHHHHPRPPALQAYAHDTAHEKIIRGLALGLALTAYGREEGADALVEQMSRDQDPILRWGAMYALGLAYRGTANNGAIARLLHCAVTDVSDDVRRAAVMCLGFVLMGNPEQVRAQGTTRGRLEAGACCRACKVVVMACGQKAAHARAHEQLSGILTASHSLRPPLALQCPRIVSLLAESFNPHVRYGAAMAVGIACAGSGGREAVALLEGMMADAVDFVRQVRRQPRFNAGWRPAGGHCPAPRQPCLCALRCHNCLGALLTSHIMVCGFQTAAHTQHAETAHTRRECTSPWRWCSCSSLRCAWRACASAC